MTAKDRQTLAAIRGFTAEHGYSPSVRDLLPLLGLSSPSAVHARLSALQRSGLVSWTPGLQRTLRVIDQEGL